MVSTRRTPIRRTAVTLTGSPALEVVCDESDEVITDIADQFSVRSIPGYLFPRIHCVGTPELSAQLRQHYD